MLRGKNEQCVKEQPIACEEKLPWSKHEKQEARNAWQWEETSAAPELF